MDLNLYNNDIISQYRGKGYLILQDGRHVDCAFYACQFFNGKIHILCKFNSASFMAFGKDAVRFEGKTKEGFLIFGSGRMHYIKAEMGNYNFATYLVSELYITSDDNIKADRLIFGLTNLELDGNKHKIELELQNDIKECVEIELEPMNDYTSIISQLEALNGVNVTYQAVIEVGKKENLLISERLVDDLCYLLSVAQGTKIQWIYIDRRAVDNCVISRQHFKRSTKRYNSSKLIPTNGIEEFIKCTYPIYKEKRIALRLDKGLIDAYLDAQSQEDYLETRAVKLAVTIEMLKATLLELPEFELNEYIIDNDYFKYQIAPILCDKLQEIQIKEATFPTYLKNKDIKLDCLNSINCINRVSFRRILKNVCKFVCPMLKRDINKFVESRNSLIHNARFNCQMLNPKCDNSEKIDEYFFLINFINILILRLLGYNGDYYDYGDIRNMVQIKKL